MRIQALESFSLLNFSTWQPGKKMGSGRCPPGEYELLQDAHPDEALRVHGEKKLPNPILRLANTSEHYGACLGWWENEVEAGRMRWIIPPAAPRTGRTDTLQMGTVRTLPKPK